MNKTISAEELPNHNLIAIDGTSGSGKSTLAKGVAKELSLDFLETGSLYRAATLLCLRNDVDVNDEKAILDILDSFNFRFDKIPFLDDKDISGDIKSHEVVMNVSYLSVHPKVREAITQLIRRWIVEHNGGVIEGRDITSVVAPNSKICIFVDAPEHIRAQRRTQDPKDNVNDLSKSQINEGIALRDKIDSSRKASPLTKVDGVWELDSSIGTLEERIEKVVSRFKSDI